MQHLWDHLDEITRSFQRNQTKLLMFDFDGTLTPIVRSYKAAVIPLQTRQLLQQLAKKKGLYLGIISGRRLKDLKNKIKIPGIIYAGTHGFEGEILHKKYSFPVPKDQLAALNEIRRKLQDIACQFNGALIEDKKITLAFHYRLVEKQQLGTLKLLFDQIVKPYKDTQMVSVVAGKKVLDVRPAADWNKGCFAELMVDKITKATNSIPIVLYIGDDKTDEDVFKKLKNFGITIRVGKHNQSSAKYYLKNTGEVVKFLEWINSHIVVT